LNYLLGTGQTNIVESEFGGEEKLGEVVMRGESEREKWKKK
jgi:hypothetical protein